MVKDVIIHKISQWRVGVSPRIPDIICYQEVVPRFLGAGSIKRRRNSRTVRTQGRASLQAVGDRTIIHAAANLTT